MVHFYRYIYILYLLIENRNTRQKTIITFYFNRKQETRALRCHKKEIAKHNSTDMPHIFDDSFFTVNYTLFGKH